MGNALTYTRVVVAKMRPIGRYPCTPCTDNRTMAPTWGGGYMGNLGEGEGDRDPPPSPLRPYARMYGNVDRDRFAAGLDQPRPFSDHSLQSHEGSTESTAREPVSSRTTCCNPTWVRLKLTEQLPFKRELTEAAIPQGVV